MDITPWLVWFLDTLNATLLSAMQTIDQTMVKVNFWRQIDQIDYHQGNKYVLNRLLDGEFELGINSCGQKVTKKPEQLQPVIYYWLRLGLLI